jgi:hypothetical protein
MTGGMTLVKAKVKLHLYTPLGHMAGAVGSRGTAPYRPEFNRRATTCVSVWTKRKSGRFFFKLSTATHHSVKAAYHPLNVFGR